MLGARPREPHAHLPSLRAVEAEHPRGGGAWLPVMAFAGSRGPSMAQPGSESSSPAQGKGTFRPSD